MVEVHKCPVCSGSGEVPYNFYNNANGIGIVEKCRTCNGSGILWEPSIGTNCSLFMKDNDDSTEKRYNFYT